MPNAPASITVVPRVDKETGEVVLFINDAPARPDHVLCYAHVGQHSEAALTYYTNGTRAPHDTSECAALLREYEQQPPRARLIVRRYLNRALLRKQWR